MRRRIHIKLIDMVVLGTSCLGVGMIGYAIIKGGWY